ncbi:AlpA-like DNA binding protein [Arthrobacter phage Sonny]|uniref:AlpA-like DNA binding protein n=2 Tax=Marthavirus shade TaxID=2560306 RepID=A0A0U4JK59_9CAUD|nr:DNA binding protein [Arthrobacter phage Sonny]YP_009612525.1 DNA binding protein [Arthrobacter phage Shade]ALY10340.1 AlpA-like DNA binding protein [Arthrobacter phage Sonny]ASR80626.1 AlpA-like DNA binding protein [Arthrobacter phage Jordan]ASR80777.1 AlpA-like DNA binding protein [Arthrobacter phage Shade]
MATTTKLLDYKALAEKLGVTVGTVRTYNERARSHRERAAETGDNSHILQGDLPEPDGRFGQSPYWNEKTIDKWIKDRPGQDHSNRRDTASKKTLARRAEAREYLKTQSGS